MTDAELKQLKDNLWHSADVLRAGAHLAANKYGQPILGLIFLRYADILFKQHKDEIEAEYNKFKGGRMEKSIKEIAIEKCGFFLPECAYYDYINDAPDDANKATIVKKAMEAIEDENPKMLGVLPKEVYAQLVPEEEPELLSNIVRIFKDIPENCTVDIFGEIYEYFLGNFALAEGKDGGTFYTPATVVRYMVEVLNPEPGDKKFLDPACGSGGMFVQAARYMHNHNASEAEQMKFRCYGVEKEPDTVKLAKMNLLLNNVRGEITEANTFYSDPYNSIGQFDYVMANPPFNVDEVNYERVSKDDRFTEYGVPRNKSKSSKKESDKKETVPNANYLWIGLFAAALNYTGKAALVMANQASDASGSELDIRKKLIEEGIICQMVTLPSNMFTSVTLPATLWFFDKAKAKTERKNEILFIDARGIYTKVDRAHRKFSEEQIKNLGIITKLYNGNTEAFEQLLQEYKENLQNAPVESGDSDQITKEYWQAQIDWLTDRFPEGIYRDVIGLCKVATLDEEDGIKDQDYSLNPGRYVGVVFEDDDTSAEEFKVEMKMISDQFVKLNEDAKGLEAAIADNLKKFFED
ncbi:MAG TPA: N-6 DNA methylase [Lachnospiraceae bacterium]|nr:N-6 DNA methylase [Lachnospiraceae bacterium]